MGIDVGGERKGFDLAVVDADLTLVDSGAHLGVPDVIGLVKQWNPAVIAIDSPCEPAPLGEHLRKCELQLNGAVCGIRWTPDISAIEASNYYAWMPEATNVTPDELARFPCEINVTPAVVGTVSSLSTSRIPSPDWPAHPSRLRAPAGDWTASGRWAGDL